VYGMTFLVLTGIEKVLRWMGPSQTISQLISTMWGLHFIFATLIAATAKKAFQKLGRASLLDNGLLTRISATSLDVMVTAAIAAISFKVFRDYWLPIALITTVGGAITTYLVVSEISRSGLDDKLVRTSSIFGTLTGTLTTGLTLSRIVDPQFKSTAVQDLVYGCGVAFPLATPIFLSMLIPLAGMNRSQTILYCSIDILILLFYTALIFILWRRWSK